MWDPAAYDLILSQTKFLENFSFHCSQFMNNHWNFFGPKCGAEKEKDHLPKRKKSLGISYVYSI